MKRDSSANGSDGPQSKFPRPTSDTSNVVIRFLIPCRAAGIMIGKGGENIKKIRTKFNVKLNIPDNRGPERIMTIEGDLKSICDVMRDVSPKLRDIINARLSDPRRIMGNFVPRRRGRPGQDQDEPEKEEDEDAMLDYRILVHESQAGSVIGRGGERIKELREKFKMRVIKVYQMLAPMSTDRVVQMVAEPENAISCIQSVIEAVESAPPRGRREIYDAANFCEADAMNYGGWLSREAVQAYAQGVPVARAGGMPPMDYMNNPYMMGGDMGPQGHGGMGPMGGGHGHMGSNRGPPMGGRGPRAGGGMSGSHGGPRGPTPVPPPSGQRSNAPSAGANIGGYGISASNQYGNQGMSNYDVTGGYDNTMYRGMDQSAQSGYGSQGYSGPSAGGIQGGNYGGSSYGSGSQRGAGDMSVPSSTGPRGGNYGGYGAANPSVHDDAKSAQWYGGWA